MTELELAALVRALAEQQTALLAAHAESMRVQRVLIERLSSADRAVPAPESAPAEMSGTASTPTEHQVAFTTIAPAAPTVVGEPVEGQSADTIATGAEREIVVADPPPVMEEVDRDRPAPQVIGGPSAGRSDRYYRSAARQQPAPVSVNPERLNMLRAIHSVGDLGHMVLMFGPHAGETLGQVAQDDIEYLRELARTAQRADVRAAAARLVGAVPSDPPVHRKGNGQRSRRGR
jgi:hypothetical protein